MSGEAVLKDRLGTTKFKLYHSGSVKMLKSRMRVVDGMSLSERGNQRGLGKSYTVE